MAETQKAEMAIAVSELVTEFGDMVDKMRRVAGVWNDRSYDPAGGSNKILTADLTGTAAENVITQAQLTEFPPLVNNFIKFLDELDPSIYNYQQRINLIRDEVF